MLTCQTAHTIPNGESHKGSLNGTPLSPSCVGNVKTIAMAHHPHIGTACAKTIGKRQKSRQDDVSCSGFALKPLHNNAESSSLMSMQRKTRVFRTRIECNRWFSKCRSERWCSPVGSDTSTATLVLCSVGSEQLQRALSRRRMCSTCSPESSWHVGLIDWPQKQKPVQMRLWRQ
jgi:hypothetical protein